MECNTLALDLGGRMAEPIVTNAVHFAWQDMAQVSTDELHAGERFCLDVVTLGAVLPPEGVRLSIGGNDAAVADGGAENVGAEVFDGGDSRAKRLDVDPPVDAPERRACGLLPADVCNQNTDQNTD